MNVAWGKCEGDVWCGFNSLNVNEYFDGKYGVYIIWRYAGNYPETIYVGQGMIGQRILAHRSNLEIQRFGRNQLLVTWTVLSDRDTGLKIEAYLWNELQPRIGDYQFHPRPEYVNLPWGK